MSKSIENLIPDIQNLLKSRGWFTDELSSGFTTEVGSRLQEQYRERTETPRLRLSQMGPRCPKALWYSLHHPELAEALPPWAEFKYSFGHIIEGMAIALAKAAGHEVTGEQDELVFEGITGHRDCVIDGVTVDVKSTSTPGFLKVKKGEFDDGFGYLDQLSCYILAGHDDPLVKVKDKGRLLFIDKQMGHMIFHETTVTRGTEDLLRTRAGWYKEISARDTAPECRCGTEVDTYTGNVRLDTRASYSSYKHSCFPHLRTALYVNGPVFFTYVKKWPWNKNGPIAEIDRYGNPV